MATTTSAEPALEQLDVFLGQWRTEGETIGQPDSPAVPIVSSDSYEWLEGGHTSRFGASD